MLLVFVTAILAVCGAAKLDNSYLPPITAKTAGGTPEFLLAPVERSNPPTGSYVNDEEGVVVDAVSPGTRASGAIPTGLGGPRTTYGSTNSKVGDAAFTAPVPAFGSNIATRITPAFNSIVGDSENKGDHKLRILSVEDPSLEKKPSENEKSHANTLKFDNELSKEKYSYGYETDNGISVGENGVSSDGVEANGGYSYEGDDGKVYSVSYTADKDGYRPKGSHLPTPPPIPVEIVKSLEDNARDEAKGIVDDGSYDVQKYNIENEYSNDNHKNDLSKNGDSTDSFIIRHGNHATQFNLRNHEFNSQAPEFLGDQSPYKYNPSGFGEHVFINKHFGFKENAEVNHGHIGFKSPFELYNTGFSSPDKSISNPHAGNSFAKAEASTGSDVNNQKLIKSENNLHRTPIPSVDNSAYSTATVVGFGSASSSASTVPNHATIGNKYSPLHIRTFGEYEQDSKFGKGSSASESDKSILSYPTVTSPSTSISDNQPNIGTASSHSGNLELNENSKSVYKQSHNSEVPSAHYTLRFPLVSAPTKVPALELSTPVEPNESSAVGSSTSDLLISKPQSTISSIHQISQLDSTLKLQNVQHNSQLPHPSIDQTEFSHAILGPSTIKPVHKHESSDSSYHYNHPPRHFFTESGTESTNFPARPIVDSLASVPFYSPSQNPNSLNIPTSNSVSTTTSPQFGQVEEYMSTSYYNDKTQASMTPFTPTLSTDSSINMKLNSQASPQQNKGTIYHYDKLSGTIFSNKKTSNLSGFQLVDGTSLTKHNEQQNSFDISSGSHFGLHQQLGSGTSTGAVSQSQPQSQYDKKGFDSQSVMGTYTSTQKGSLLVPQFGQNNGLKGQSTQQTTGYGQQPFGSSKTTSATFSQNTFGITSGSQFGQSPQQQQSTVLGIKGENVTQNSPDSQFVNKVESSQSTAGTLQTSVDSSSPVPQFGQNTGIKSSGKFPLTQKGSSSVSQFGQNTGIKGQSTQQTNGFGQQPFGSYQTTSSTFSQNNFGGTCGSQFGQNPQQEQSTVLGTKGKIGSQNSPHSHFATKLESSQSATGTIQTSVESSSPVSQFGQRSSIGSQFGQHLQTGSGSSASVEAQVNDRIAFGSQSAIGTFPSTQKGSSSVSQFGPNTGIKGQSTQQTTGFGQQPFGSSQTSSTFSQNTFGTTSGLHFGQNTQQQQSTVLGTKGKIASQNSPDSQLATKVESIQSTPGTLQTSVANSSPVPQFGQNTGTKSTGNFLLTQKGSSSVSQFGQNTGINGQSTQQSTGFGQQPFGSFQTTSSTFSQNAFGGTSGSHFGQNPQQQQSTVLGTKEKIASQNSPNSQFATKVESSQSTTGTVQTSVKSSSSIPQLGQNTYTKGQSAQQELSQKPFGFSHTTGSSLSQYSIGSSPGSQSSLQQNKGQIYHYDKPGVNIFSNKETSKLSGFQLVDGTRTSLTNQNEKQSSFGSSLIGSQFAKHLQPGSGSSASAIAQVQPQSQYNTKSFGSQSATGTFPSTQKGSSSVSQFGQNTGIKGQSTQQTTGFGQQPFGSSQTSSTFSQNTFGTTSGLHFGQNTQQQQSTVLGTKGKIASQNSPDSQLATKVESIQSTPGTLQTSVENSSPVPQFGQNTGTKSTGNFLLTQKGSSSVSQFGQNTGIKGQSTQKSTGFGQQPFGSFQTTSSTFSQNAFGGTSGSHFGQNPQQQQSTVLGTKGKIASQNSPNSQFATKVETSQSTTGTVQTSVKSSSSAPQFGQNTYTKGQSAQQELSEKPFGFSHTTGSSLSQYSIGSSPGSQSSLQQNKGQIYHYDKPSVNIFSNKETSKLSGFHLVDGSRTSLTNQNEKQSSFGSSSIGSQFAKHLQPGSGSSASAIAQVQPQSQYNTKSFGSQSATGTFPSTQKGSSSVSQFGQNTGIKGQSTQQTTGFGQQPFGSSQTSSTFSQNTFGTTSGLHFGQNTQQQQSTVLETKGKIASQNSPDSQLATKVESIQSTPGTLQTSVENSSPVPQFGQNTGTKSTGNFPLTQKGFSSVSQFGQNTGIKGQSTQQSTGFGQQPFGSFQTTSSTFSQNAFGGTSGSHFGQNPQQQQSTVLGTKGKIASQNSPNSQFATKVESSQSTTGTVQTSVKSSSSVPQFGQNTYTKGQSAQQELSQKPFGFSHTTGSNLSQYSIGSSPGSQSSLQQNKGQIYHYDKPGVNIFPNKETSKLSGFQLVDGSRTSLTNQNEKQSSFGSSSVGSQFAKHLQPGSGSSVSAIAQVQPQSQYNTKSFGSQSATGTFPSTQKGSSSVSQFGQNTGIKGQSTQQTTGFGQQPFGSSQASSTFSQNTFGTTSGLHFGQNTQQQQSTVLGTKGKIASQNSPDSQLATKVESIQSTPGTLQTSVENSSPVPQFGQNTGTKSTGNFLLTQNGSTLVSQFGQNTGIKGQSTQQSTGFGQQPFGSFQTSSTFSQNAFGGTSGSQFGQNQQQHPSTVLGTKEKIASQNSPNSQFATKVESSQSTTGTVQTSVKSSSSIPQLGQNTYTKGQSAQQELSQKPFGFSHTTGSSLSQYSIGSSPGSQSSLQQNKGQIYHYDKPGVNIFSNKETSKLSGFQLVDGTRTSLTNQNEKQSSFGSSLIGSQFAKHLQPGSGSSASAIAQVQPQSQYNTKSFGSQSATGTFPSTQKGSSSVSQFGQNTGIKGQSTQQTTGFGQQPFGSSQTSSTFSQNTFGTTSGLHFGQNTQQQQSTVLGTKGKIASQNSPDSQLATKVESIQSTPGTLQTSVENSSPVPQFGQNTGTKSTGNFLLTQKGSSSVSQFGQNTGIKGQSTQQSTGFGQQPFGSFQTTSSTFSQNAFGGTSGSHFGQNPQQQQSTVLGTKGKIASQNSPNSQFATKVETSQSTTGTVQTSVKSSSSAPQFGQNTYTKGQSAQQELSEKPFGFSHTTGSSLSQYSIGSSPGSQSSLQQNKGQIYHYDKPSINIFSNKETSKLSGFHLVDGSRTSLTNQNEKQSSFGSSSIGSQFAKHLQPGSGSSASAIAQVQPQSQYNTKSFGSQSATGTFPSTQKGSSSVSQFGQNTGIKGQSTQQTTGFGQQPFGSSQTSSTFSQNTFGTTSGLHFGQNTQQQQSTVLETKGKIASQNSPDSQLATKVESIQSTPGTLQTSVENSSPVPQFGQNTGTKSTGNFPLTQKGFSSVSQFGQNTGIKGQSTQQSTGFGQQPFGSFQTTSSTFSQNAFGGTSGSHFGQNPQQQQSTVLGTKGKIASQNSPNSQFATKVESSQSTTGTVQTSVKSSSSVPQFGQNTYTKGQSAQQELSQTPFGFSHTTGSNLSQYSIGSAPGSQSSLQQNKGQIYHYDKPGVNIFSNKETSKLSGFQLVDGTRTSLTNQNEKQSSFGSSSIGSQFSKHLQPGSGSSVSAIAQVQPQSQYNTKSFGSQSATGTFPSTQKGSLSVSQFGQNTGIKGQSTQQTTGFGQQPFGPSQTTTSTFSQNTFGSAFGSQFGQKPQFVLGTKENIALQNLPHSQFVNSESTIGTLQSVVTQSETLNDSSNNEGSQLPESLIDGQTSSLSSQFINKLNQPFVKTQTPFLSQYDYISEQRPQNTASAFATSNLGPNRDIATDRVSNYAITQFGDAKSETAKPFVNSLTYSTHASQDSSSKLDDNTNQFSTSSDFGILEHRQLSSQPIVPSSPAVHFNTKTNIIPGTQISIDQLRSAVTDSKIKAYTFNEKSSQSSGTELNGVPLKSYDISSFGLRSQDSSKFPSAVSTAQASVSNVKYEKQPYNSFVGSKELFAEHRELPKFDINTGYHY